MLMAGKGSFCPAAQSPADTRALHELLRGCDVVVVSADEATLPDAMLEAAVKTGTVVVDICSLAEPQAGGGAPDDLALQALSGMMETTGMAHGPPCPVDGEPLEMIAALHAATGALAALMARQRDALGQRVCVSLMDCAISSHAVFVSRLVEQPDAPATRSGNRHLLASPWNVFRAADGWLLICMATEAQWRRACELMGDPALSARPGFDSGAARQKNLDAVEATVQAWVETMDVATVSRVLLDAGIPCGAVAPVDGYPREPNLEHRGMVARTLLPGGGEVYLCGSPMHASVTPGITATRVPARDADRERVLARPWPPRAPATPSPSCGAPPLAGVRVLELGHFTTAPLAGRYLANLGAEVIKVEPPGGEAMRPWQPQRHGLGAFFIANNTGKRSVILDLKSSAGLRATESLVRSADVLIENLKPGALQRLGLSFERMQALNPGIVYCAVSGFGVDSVYPGRPAYDMVIQAMSGAMDRTRAGEQPVKTGMSGADVMGANFAVGAVVAALLHRARTGEGQLIDVAMQDVAAWGIQLAWNGAVPVRHRSAVRACADGHVVVAPPAPDAAMEEAIPRLTRAACRARWPGRVWPVNAFSEVLGSPLAGVQVLEVDDAAGRTWPVLRNPIRLSRTPLRHAPIESDLGADNERLLHE